MQRLIFSSICLPFVPNVVGQQPKAMQAACSLPLMVSSMFHQTRRCVLACQIWLKPEYHKQQKLQIVHMELDLAVLGSTECLICAAHTLRSAEDTMPKSTCWTKSSCHKLMQLPLRMLHNLSCSLISEALGCIVELTQSHC